MVRRFHVRKEILEYLKRLLLEDKIPFELEGEDVLAELSGNKFHRYLKNAVCLQRYTENQIPYRVLPKEVILNDRALLKVLSDFSTSEFTMLEEEINSILQSLERREGNLFVEEKMLITKIEVNHSLSEDFTNTLPYCKLIPIIGNPVGNRFTKKGILLCKHLLAILYQGKEYFYPIL